jgi:hypothetical protein
MSWYMSFGGFDWAYRDHMLLPQQEIDAPPKEGTQPGEAGESR